MALGGTDVAAEFQTVLIWLNILTPFGLTFSIWLTKQNAKYAEQNRLRVEQALQKIDILLNGRLISLLRGNAVLARSVSDANPKDIGMKLVAELAEQAANDNEKAQALVHSMREGRSPAPVAIIHAGEGVKIEKT